MLKEIHNQMLLLEIKTEVIVIDDGSTNHQNLNESSCKKMGLSYYMNRKNIGRVATRQKLAKESKFEHLLFIDADMIPKTKSFLKKYEECLFLSENIVFGGYAYDPNGNRNHLLRYNYGIQREEKKANIRSRSPYKHIYSGNVLIEKELFLKTNHESNNRYGLDCVFSANLKKLGRRPLHIDNETFHNGIESNLEFINKTKEGVKTMFWLYQHNQITHRDNKLIRVFKLIEKWRLMVLFKWIGKIIIVPVEKLLIKNKAPMIFIDFYRLYHFSIS